MVRPAFQVGILPFAALVGLPSLAYAQTQTILFDIPQQPAVAGIPAFARAANIQIVVAAEAVRGQLTNPVRGTYSVQDALRILLAGTGIKVETNDGKLIVLAAEQRPDSLNLTGPANQTVTITGTTIRGQAPIGSNLILLERRDIEETGAQTVQQILSTIPQINSSFANAAQGAIGSADASGTQAPTIHSLGNSASNGTLILIDGHRVPLSGVDHTLADPSIIPPAAIQRIEVLPDGASAIYGSDAVAGVLNFITRKNFSGLETSAQAGFADNYSTSNFSQLLGHSWGSGSLLAIYNYSNRSRLMNRDRSFITARQDLRLGVADSSLFIGLPNTPPSGTPTTSPYPSLGGNFQNFNCPVASIARTSTSPAFIYPYTGNGISVTQANPSLGVCDTVGAGSSLPSEMRNTGMISISQSIAESLLLTVDLIHSSRLGSAANARGTVSGTVFNPLGTGGPALGTRQMNPFYVPVPGQAADNSQFIRMSFDDLLGSGASTKNGAQTTFTTLGLSYDLGGEWSVALGSTLGVDYSFASTQGFLNASEALLALNGTVNSNGTANVSPASTAITDPFGLSSVTSVTRALTSANALDVWRPASSNRTSPAVLRSLTDSAGIQSALQSMQNITLKVDGPVLSLPAGDVKAAIGGEFIHYGMDLRNTLLNSAGPGSTSSRAVSLSFSRSVYAAYLEFVVPIIGAEQNIPLMRGVTADIAGRYDHYGDFGSTTNPKISFDWDIIEGVRGRGSFGTSFTAPALTSSGQLNTGITGGTSISSGGAQNNLTVLFNTTLPYNDSAGIAGTFVATPEGCSAAGSTVVDASGNPVSAPSFIGATGCRINATASTGININGGRPDLKPEIGQTWSGGFDLNAGSFVEALSGLSAKITYYQAKFGGLVTNLGTQASLPQLTTFAPAGGWDPNDPVIQRLLVGRPLLAPLPARVWSIFDSRQQNAFTIWQNGLDFDIDYKRSTGIGDFHVNFLGNQIFRFSQKNGLLGAVLDIKNGKNNGRFLGAELQYRLNVGWRRDPYSFGLAVNFIHPYNVSTTSFPYTFPGPNRAANTAHVGALYTVDLNGSVALPGKWISGGELGFNVTNLLDTPPPFVNSTNGFSVGSQIGRLVSVSLRKKW